MSPADEWKHLYSEVQHDYVRVLMALEQAIADLREVGNDYPGSSCQQWCNERADEAAKAIPPRSVRIRPGTKVTVTGCRDLDGSYKVVA